MDTILVETKGSKKRAGTQNSTADKNNKPKVERKRVQNRISQQCVRERHLAHALQLESLLETIKTANGANSNTGGNTIPLSAYLKLVEENEMLKDALLRLRKRMLSYSNLVGSSASMMFISYDYVPSINQTLAKNMRPFRYLDDEIFDYILSGSTKSQGTKETVSCTTSPGLSGQENSIKEPSVTPIEGPSPSEQRKCYPTPAMNFDGQPRNERVPLSATACSVEDREGGGLGGEPQGVQIEPTNPGTQNDRAAFNSTSASLPDVLDFQMPLFAAYHDISTPNPNFNTLTPQFDFTPDMVRQSCMGYLNQVLGTQELDNNGEKTANLVDKLATVAVALLANLSGLESSIYGLGASEFMWAAIRWRLSPTAANHSAIPEPYRPTALQCTTPNHSLVIDFIAWPTIRDQLILHSHECDIDLVMRDILLHTIFEVHHQRIAVNVLDFFHHKISGHAHCKNANGDPILNPKWKFVDAAPVFTLFDPNLAGQDHLIREIYWRMPFSTVSTESRRSDLISRYGIDQCSQWKLSQAFARKYMFLDCSLVTTPYSMVPCSAIPGL